jgi:hypothetical protein
MCYFEAVLKASSELCLQIYVKPIVKDTNYYLVVGRNKVIQT